MGGCCRHDTCAKSARNGGGSHVPDTAGRRVAPRRCASRDRGPGAPRRRSGPGTVDSMTFHWSFASYSLVAVGLADGVASTWVLRNRGAIGRVSVAMLLATAGVWCVAYGLELAAAEPGHRELWGACKYLGSTLLPPPGWSSFSNTPVTAGRSLGGCWGCWPWNPSSCSACWRARRHGRWSAPTHRMRWGRCRLCGSAPRTG